MHNDITLPTVNFLETLKALQKNEWNSLGLNEPEPCQVIDLPTGGEDILTRLWAVFSNKPNFSNDCKFTYVFPTRNGEQLPDDLQVLHDYCQESIVNHELLFDVCW